MDNLKDASLLIPLFFAAFGFFLGFFLRRGFSLVFLGVFLFASFKGLETLKFSPDWFNFYKFSTAIQELGRTLLAMICQMIASAGTVSILLFISGGVTGLILSRRGA